MALDMRTPAIENGVGADRLPCGFGVKALHRYCHDAARGMPSGESGCTDHAMFTYQTGPLIGDLRRPFLWNRPNSFLRVQEGNVKLS